MATGFHRSVGTFSLGGRIDEDSAEGARFRSEVGEKLVREVGREFRTVGLQIGYRYDDSPICVPDGTSTSIDTPEAYVPCARPGSRAPHFWLRDGRSVLDLYGSAFVLLRFSGAPPATAIEEAARSRRVPLTTITLEEPEAAALYERRMVLVRPDGHVAWRGDCVPTDALALIDRVRGAA
jgi:hypothetical protein